MLPVRDWQARLIVAAAMVGLAWLFCSSYYSAGYQAGVLAAVETVGVESWGTCREGWSGWARCARSTDGRLLLVRGLR